MCFNAAPDLALPTDGWYCEGLTQGVPHGWVDLDGTILDPTWPDADTADYQRKRLSRADTTRSYDGVLPRFIWP
jgi:hypothetical protein